MSKEEIKTRYDELRDAEIELLQVQQEEDKLGLRKKALQKKVSILRDRVREIRM